MIEASDLKSSTGLRHGFFTRQGGHSAGLFASLNCGFGSGDDKPTVARNRATAGDALGVSASHLLTVWQWHSPDVIVADAPWDPLAAPKGDAIVTAKRGLAVAVLTADCAPLLFADTEAGVIGAAHAGWKGALAGVSDATIAAMEKLGARRRRITAIIGPTISQPAYEVGPEFPAPFLAQDADNADFFASSGTARHHMFDLPGYLARRMTGLGIGKVVDLGLCTYSDEDRFYSYRRATHRREQDYGRQISAIVLNAD
ncbi:peptidoglycan editing factor PgeF [Nordella sp. HKS 07]|uniref:peptidoglycan editing factor PgeF n=1 Tax=Nordella sp. HKS 07 TaxID=2712222 RepID=UPI0013E1800E|nr:peptidoglycan editing factor PgeF [Nordella sp. HKS 07]QIG46477.1 peptidoglycan editing factor PgeF [Nordella sp. HKS 07]